jgi:hypothetical protein
MSLDGISKSKQAALFQALLEDMEHEHQKKECLVREDVKHSVDGFIKPSPILTQKEITTNEKRRYQHPRSSQTDRLR